MTPANIEAPSPKVEPDAGRGSTTRPARTLRRCADCRHAGRYAGGLVCGIELPPHIEITTDPTERFVEVDDSCDLWDSAL